MYICIYLLCIQREVALCALSKIDSAGQDNSELFEVVVADGYKIGSERQIGSCAAEADWLCAYAGLK